MSTKKKKAKSINFPLETVKQIIKEQDKFEAEKILGLDKTEPEEKEKPQITKAKIIADNNCEIHYSIGKGQYSGDPGKPIHDDLRNAFEELIPHWAILADIKEYKKPGQTIEDCDIIGREHLRVTGFSIKNEGITITGIRSPGESGMPLPAINSAYTSFHSDSYPYNGALYKTVEKIKAELLLYLFERKYG